jgi:hypothetical protein
MLRLSSRRAVVAVSAAGLLAAGATLPAQAAAVPGWHVNATFPVAGRETILTSVAAVSAKDAWAAGLTLNEKAGTFGSLIRHWTGRKWAAVTLPAKVAATWSRSLPVGSVVGASSPSDVWIFGAQTNAAYLRLNGRRWSVGHLPGTVPAAQKFVQVNAVRVFSKSNVWAFGATENESSPQVTVTPYAAHYNGVRWTVTHVPGNSGIVSVSAASASSIWAVAGADPATVAGPGSPSGEQAVLHWGPKGGWQQIVQPALPKGALLGGVTLESGRVLVAGSEPNGRKGRSPFLVTWNGTAWSALSVAGASPTKWQIAGLAADGRGGFWVLGFRNSGNPGKLWHVVAGQWTAAAATPFGKHAWLLEQITAVPHTDSVWGAGALKVGKNGALGLIGLAGPTPR